MRTCLIIITTLLMLTGCRHTASDPAIRQAELLADSLPRQTLAILDSIPESPLGDHDLFLHRFLTLKAKDKLFITHRNDSLLRLILDYAENNPRSVNYPEVLYFAGRVYNDMGDYPTALEYYYNSLDLIPEDEKRLRAKVLSYIGYIYLACGLYDKGIEPYKEAISLDSISCDSLNMMYDLIDLSTIYFKKGDYDRSEDIIRQVIRLSEISHPEIRAEQELLLAKIKLFKHEFDSARILIADNVDKVESITYNSSLGIAAKVYYYAGDMDSAYYYADRLLKSSDMNCKSKAYELLLSDGLRDRVSKDSIGSYIKHHTQIMVDLLKRNGDKEIPLKETQYNYNRHIKERLKAEQHSRKITYYLLLSTAFLLLLTILFTWYRLKSHKQKLQLIEFQRDIAELKNKIVELHTRKEEKIQNPGADYSDTLLTGIERGEYNFIDSYLPPHIIRESDVYKIIREKIKRGQVIDMENQIWDDLEAVILSVFPTFTSDLVSLLDRPLKIQERVIVLMTKSGFSISDISAIIGRKKGVVTYHRKEMGKAIFKKEVKSVYIDPVIRLIGNIKINR